ncbi:MAG: LAGLIDADG family homing endonuclease [archaeon]
MKFDVKNVNLSYYDKKIGLILPECPSCELAEFIGILTGDGYMNKYGKYFSIVEIVGDPRFDKAYLENHVTNMINNLFNLKPKVDFKRTQNLMSIRLMSKGLNNYLELVGFKSGKKGQIGIPSWILENDEYMKFFIKGLVDTDGCLTLLNRKHKNFNFYPRVQITSISKSLIDDVGTWLSNQGFSVCLMKDCGKRTYKGVTKIHEGYRFNINGYTQLQVWMNLIGFRNKRHLDKYEKLK